MALRNAKLNCALNATITVTITVTTHPSFVGKARRRGLLLHLHYTLGFCFCFQWPFRNLSPSPSLCSHSCVQWNEREIVETETREKYDTFYLKLPLSYSQYCPRVFSFFLFLISLNKNTNILLSDIFNFNLNKNN